MSVESGGAGWWMASDGRWYPPHLAPGAPAPPPLPPAPLSQAQPAGTGKARGIRMLTLRRPDVCAICGSGLPVGTSAWWDPKAKTATCAEHGEPSGTEDSAGTPLDRGTPGGSARAEYERRHTRRASRLEQTWGPFAGIAKALSDDPQSTKAWAKGDVGEREVAAQLERRTAGRAILLYDRSVPGTRGNIDIVAVAPSGVWAIDVKNYSGQVAHRDVGGLFRTDWRLYVGKRNCSKLADDLGWQLVAVANALGHDHLSVKVHAALCFYEAEWSLFARPFQHGDVWVTWPKRMAEMLCAPGPHDEPTVSTLAHHIALALPSKK